MTTIRKLLSRDLDLIGPLIHLLQDAVHGGASVGFLAPLREEIALQYWQGVFKKLEDTLHLWVAESQGKVIGSIQLELCNKENGRHRGEIQKLFVLQSSRGQGVSSLLMRSAETFAANQGRTLLVLDTQEGSVAESVYRHLGWQRVGRIPNYAASPTGELHATTYFFKQIGS